MNKRVSKTPVFFQAGIPSSYRRSNATVKKNNDANKRSSIRERFNKEVSVKILHIMDVKSKKIFASTCEKIKKEGKCRGTYPATKETCNLNEKK